MMKAYKLLWLFVIGLAVSACSEDEFQEEFGQSKVENLGAHRVASFQLPYAVPEDLADENALLVQIGGNYAQAHKVKVERSENRTTSLARLTVSNDLRIPNGQFLLRFKTIPHRFIVQVSNERIGIVGVKNLENTTLSGCGSESDPYKITNKSDFDTFIKMVNSDENHCAATYFKQTVPVIQWENDEATTGEGLSSNAFAGNYDGRGYVISGLMTNGKDNAGLFTKLLNGATVRNLNLQNIKLANGKDMGAIAGCSEGTVKLSKISTSGEISGTKNIGGLVGLVQGELIIEDVTVGTSIYGNENVGGLAGTVQKGKIRLKNAGISSNFIVGDVDQPKASNVGGMVGLVNDASFQIESSSVIHTSKFEDNTKVISGATNVGGLIGKIASLNANSSITKSRVISPLRVNTNGGGFVGWAKLGKQLKVSGCQYGGIMKSGSYIGGFFGSLEYTGSNLLVYEDNDVVASNNSDIYIGGTNYVGAVFGWLSARSLSMTGENNFAMQVIGKDYVGGIAGAMKGTTLDIGTPGYLNNGKDVVGIYMEGISYVGGAVGSMETSTLKSNHSHNLTKSVPVRQPEKAKIICTINATGSYVGGAVGRANKSAISGISVNATITNTNKSDSGRYYGGIVGLFHDGNKAVESCSFYGIMKGKEYTGGIVGEINKLGQIKQCINYASVNGGNRTGGIVGKVNYVDDEPWVNECVNVGDVEADHFVGGIAGYISADGNEGKDWIKIARCGNYGRITASSTDGGCVGGLVGKCDTDKIRVNNGANHGTVVGNGGFKGIGGIAGSLGDDADVLTEWDNVHVYECVNTGAVYSDKTKKCHIGGIVGYLEEGDEGSDDTNSQVNDCYNCGKIGPTSEATHGGIIGHCDYYTSLRRCINYGDTGDKGESMIGTVVDAGVVHDSKLYHLEGSGDSSGRNWSSKSFKESEMGTMATFSGFSEKTWTIGKQVHMKSGKDKLDRAILKNCPFQNMVY